MQKHTLIASGTVLLAGLVAAPALAGVPANGPAVSVRVEGLNGTIIPALTVDTPSGGSITQGGVRAGLCPADSAQGALNVAANGRWQGKWYAQYKEYEITSIHGMTPNPKRAYYEVFLNNVAASAGACQLKLKAGDTLLFAVVPVSGKPETPLAVTTKVTQSTVTATVVGYNAKGKALPVSGATVRLGGKTVTTGATGTATLAAPATRSTLVASAPGFIRDEATIPAKSAA